MRDVVTVPLTEARARALRGRVPRRLAAVVGVLMALLLPAAARAQQETFYLDRMMIAGAPDDAIGVWRPHMAEKTRFYGQLGLGFAFLPFRYPNELTSDNARSAAAKNGQPVVAQLLAYADVGVEILDRFSFQVLAPATLFQLGNKTVAGHSETRQNADPGPAAFMDMRLDGRVILFRNDDRSFKLGAQGSIWIPTGNPYSYSSDRQTAGALSLALEGDWKRFFLVGDIGVHFRPTGALNSFHVDDELRYALGIFAPIRDGSIRLGAQIFGGVGLGDAAPATSRSTYPLANVPLEWMAEGRFWVGEKRRLYLGAGGGTLITPAYAPVFRVMALIGYSYNIADVDPPSPPRRFKTERFAEHGADTDHDKIPDDIDLCPTEPEDGKPPNPDDGCPALSDRDGDGIPDNVDKCPDNPEDFDGIQDDDGCPEDDADKDGIPDAQDACPLEPGEADPEPKKNGCPKFIRRISGSTEIQLLKNIEFATGKATILQKSFPIVDEVVRLMKVNADIKHLAIEGHTDNRGSDDLNEKLSNDRAASVMKYLVEHGIEAARLSAKGFGPKRPIADNNTVDGRQRNRRVEFHIVDQAGVTNSPPEGGAAPPP